jgi:hypothetical protein
MERVHIISNTKVLGSVFQNSQARDARQKKHGKEGGGCRDFITRDEAKKGNGRVLGVGEPDPFRNRISQLQSLREGNQW